MKIDAPKFASGRDQVRRILEDLEPADELIVDFTREGPVAPGFIQGFVEQTLGDEAWFPVDSLAMTGLNLNRAALFLYVAAAHGKGCHARVIDDDPSFHTRAAVTAILRRSTACRAATAHMVHAPDREIVAGLMGGEEKLAAFLNGTGEPAGLEALAAIVGCPVEWLTGS